jgi:hypothetical protein
MLRPREPFLRHVRHNPPIHNQGGAAVVSDVNAKYFHSFVAGASAYLVENPPDFEPIWP